VVKYVEMLEQEERVGFFLGHFEVREEDVEGRLGLNFRVAAPEGIDED
jgi:hypothetical protein